MAWPEPSRNDCGAAGRRIPTIEELIDRFTTPEPNSGCWLWTGMHDRNGYGRYARLPYGRWLAAHRFVYQHLVRPLNDEEWVLHKCDNRACVNPDHLYAGTNKENVRDRVERGRQPQGESCTYAKLTEKQVLQMREWKSEGKTQAEIIRITGLKKSTVNSVLSRVNWRHI